MILDAKLKAFKDAENQDEVGLSENDIGRSWHISFSYF